MSVEPAVRRRIGDALNFRVPDRTPIWEMLENQAVYDHFAPGVPFPRCAGIACRELGIDATYGCFAAVTDESAGDGCLRAAQTVWATKPMFASLEKLRAYNPPPIREREYEEQMLREHEEAQELYGPRTMFLPQNGGWGFLPGYDAQTFSTVAEAMVEDLPALERYWDINVERAIITNSITARHRMAPAIQCCEDVAYKNGLMVSPALLRDHFFPRFAKVIAPLKAAGIKAIWHSDGNIMPVLDEAVACGLDGINPLDPSAGMDLGAIRRKYPRLILVGNVGVDHVLRFGTPEAVRRDVRRCLEQAGPTGHLLQCGDGQVMPDCPLENVLAYFDEAHTARPGGGGGKFL